MTQASPNFPLKDL